MKNRLITAIDVGSSAIKVVMATQDADDDKLHVIGVSQLPSKGIRRGQIIDIDGATEAINNAIEAAERMAGTTVDSAFVSAGGTGIESLNSKGVVAVSEPEGEITTEDVKRVIEAARAISLPSSKEIIHVLPRGFLVDGQEGIKDPIHMTGVRLEVETHIVTGASTALHNLGKCISEVGLDIEQLVFSGLASSMAVLTDTEKELGVIMVDIGGGTTDICVFLEGALAYSIVLPVGARHITNDLAIGLRISLESAEKIKLLLTKKPKTIIEPGVTTKKLTDDEISVKELALPEELSKISRKTLTEGIIKPRLLEIFSLVSIELEKNGLLGMTPSGVVITGGGADTVGIIEACKQRLNLPVRVGMPDGLTGLVDEIQNPASSTVTGLILFGAKHTPGSKKANISLSLSNPFGKMRDKLPSLLKNFLP